MFFNYIYIYIYVRLELFFGYLCTINNILLIKKNWGNNSDYRLRYVPYICLEIGIEF